jgi:type IV secretion system protein VirB5
MLAIPASLAVAAPQLAHAQMAVIDHSTLAQALETARNTLTMIDKAQQQVDEAQRLFSSLNGPTGIGEIAKGLNSDALRRGLPDDIQTGADLVSSDLGELGSIGERARELLSRNDYSTERAGRLSQNGPSSIYASATQAARDQAIAEIGLTNAQKTSEGLGELKQHLGAADTARDVAALQARATLELVQLINQANQATALREAKIAQQIQAGLASEAARERLNEDAVMQGRILPRLGK